MEHLTVACCYWRDNQDRCQNAYQYSGEDVSLLRGQVARNLEREHEFVCITDRPGDIEDGIRTVPLDRRLHIPGGRYAKLQVFRPDAGETIGARILLLDLDTVIVGGLDPLVDRDEDLVLWRNPNFGLKRRAYYNTSIMLVRAGTRTEFYTRFDPKRSHDEAARATGWGGTDQRFVSWLAGRHEAHWTAADGIYGAGRLGDYCPGRATTVLPENARIVFFPGRRHPKMAKVRERHPWIKDHRW
ncbi:MAG: hypothetical protein ACLFPA_09230 [Dichotomicrobium sp.]